MSEHNVPFMPAGLDDLGLDPFDLRVYLRIFRRAGVDGVCFESVHNMAAGCRMSETRVHEALRELLLLGLVKRTAAAPGKTAKYTPVYPKEGEHWPSPETGAERIMKVECKRATKRENRRLRALAQKLHERIPTINTTPAPGAPTPAPGAPLPLRLAHPKVLPEKVLQEGDFSVALRAPGGRSGVVENLRQRIASTGERGMSRVDLHRARPRWGTKRIDGALRELQRAGLVRHEDLQPAGRGRPEQRWFAVPQSVPPQPEADRHGGQEGEVSEWQMSPQHVTDGRAR